MSIFGSSTILCPQFFPGFPLDFSFFQTESCYPAAPCSSPPCLVWCWSSVLPCSKSTPSGFMPLFSALSVHQWSLARFNSSIDPTAFQELRARADHISDAYPQLRTRIPLWIVTGSSFELSACSNPCFRCDSPPVFRQGVFPKPADRPW
jgi:hypothetical protein